ncbi:hypothetical protein M413DRAFT_21951, partial [Hebeloma cylindrosporum]
MEIYRESIIDAPQIAKLNHDLLWRIFSLNADIDAGPQGNIIISHNDDLFRLSPLTTARHTSQVCASWRQLIVGSPSLWGNMIDLESLQQKSDTWRNEVLLRTGNSKLSIKGNVTLDASAATEFLVSLLKTHWTRINRIQVGIYIIAQDLPGDAWDPLGCPAPSLRSCSIHFGYDLPDVYSSPGFSLFANHAPLLTSFQQHRIPMNFGAPWLANLTSLTLNSVTTLGILLDACSRMQSIQNLNLTFGTAGPSIDGQLHSVNMPLLTSLDISCPLDVSLAFLDHITPAPGCYLHLFSTVSSHEDMTPAEVVSAQRITMKFAKNYFSHRISTSFFLQISPRIISTGDIPPKIGLMANLDPRFKGFTIDVYDLTRLPTSLFALCFGTFVPAHFSRVKKLTLASMEIPPTVHTLEPLFANWFTTMATLETLKLTADSLAFIDSLAGAHFPHLKTVEWLPSSSKSPNRTSLIMNFLATRRKMGMPIETLDLTG